MPGQIGQAVRTALFQGMHTELPQQVFGTARVERARNIWWTVYMLDRELSSLMGLPIQMADENITAQFPAPETQEQATAFRLHVKLCRVIARVVGSEFTQLIANYLLTASSGLRPRRPA